VATVAGGTGLLVGCSIGQDTTSSAPPATEQSVAAPAATKEEFHRQFKMINLCRKLDGKWQPVGL
jgi:hypothetical protein